MKEIPLRNSRLKILVDDEDYETLARFKWYLSKRGRATCAPIITHLILHCPDGQLIDHRNGNLLDNRRLNLRIANRAQNSQNTRKRAAASSAYKGVGWHKKTKKWYARLRTKERTFELGVFREETEAARAYDSAALHVFGEYAVLNFPEDVPMPFDATRYLLGLLPCANCGAMFAPKTRIKHDAAQRFCSRRCGSRWHYYSNKTRNAALKPDDPDHFILY